MPIKQSVHARVVLRDIIIRFRDSDLYQLI